MTRYADWRTRHDGAPVVDPLTLIGPGGLVVIAPHPDDESLGVSALLVAAGRAGRRVAVVALTDGEGSHRGSVSWQPERLAERRREEQMLALAELGCGNAAVLRLKLLDGGARWHRDFAAAAGMIAHLADEIGASAIASSVPFDPHPDHEAAALLAEDVRRLRPRLRLLSYPVWSLRHEDGVEVDTNGLHPFRVDTPLPEKARAIARHETQFGTVVDDDPSGFALPDWFLRHHQGPHECLFWHAMPGTPPGPEHFAALYAGDGDPWHVRSAPYEIEKRDAALAFLGDQRFLSAIEIGCGEGHLTARLAERSDTALGIDLDPEIVTRAAAAHEGAHGLEFRQARMPDAFPARRFDLVVLSEVLYFLDEAEIEALLAKAADQADDGASMLLVNYLGETGTPLSGDDAADFLIASAADWRLVRSQRREGYRLDLMRRRAPD